MIEFKLQVIIDAGATLAWGTLTVWADHIDTAIQIAKRKGYTVKVDDV